MVELWLRHGSCINQNTEISCARNFIVHLHRKDDHNRVHNIDFGNLLRTWGRRKSKITRDENLIVERCLIHRTCFQHIFCRSYEIRCKSYLSLLHHKSRMWDVFNSGTENNPNGEAIQSAEILKISIIWCTLRNSMPSMSGNESKYATVSAVLFFFCSYSIWFNANDKKIEKQLIDEKNIVSEKTGECVACTLNGVFYAQANWPPGWIHVPSTATSITPCT